LFLVPFDPIAVSTEKLKTFSILQDSLKKLLSISKLFAMFSPATADMVNLQRPPIIESTTFALIA
jgi:hypothetical protein